MRTDVGGGGCCGCHDFDTAIVIGGLISSTALTLVVLPVLYYLVEGAKERREEKRLGLVEVESGRRRRSVHLG
ncbi:hypothetical protein [Marisediminicola antarctica]|uniref:hypothetical protein n=1 Tax=Marisediminicola antarctica TaxID=674079 RepID=UPI00137B93B2|nr:hypothetical protein [Marisediminicola antarctica]